MNAYNSTDTVISSNEGATAKNKWTVMIYHSGDADLGPEFVWSMKEIARVGVPKGVNVAAVMDSVAPVPYQFELGGGKQEKGGPRRDRLFGRNPLAEPLKVLDKDKQTTRQATGGRVQEFNAASPENLKRFIADTVEKHNAERYMLILSGHGAGIIGDTFLRDQGAGTFMTIPSLDGALRNITKELIDSSKEARGKKKIDILGFDACCMMTAEVAYSLRGEVDFIVGSEGFMTLNGWPYHEIVECLRVPNIQPDALAQEIVHQCVDYYSDFARVGTSIDLAVCHLDPVGWEYLTKAIGALTCKLRKGIQEEKNKQKARSLINAVIAAHWFAQSYGSEQYVDLLDFCERLAEAAPDFTAERDAIKNAMTPLVKKSCYAGADFQHSNGLSLYFPWAATTRELTKYRTNSEKEGREVTEFEAQTGWGEFLQYFIGETRRDPRGEGSQPTELKIDVPPEGYDSAEEHRTGTIVNTRNGTIVNIRGQLVFPRVKNPALASYEDEC